MTHEMMIVGRWNDMLTGGMMFQVGGMMCKVVALLLQMAENHLDSHLDGDGGEDEMICWQVEGWCAEPLLLQMAENHLNLPTQRPIFHTHTLFIILLLLFILTMWKNRETLNMEPERFQALIFIPISDFKSTKALTVQPTPYPNRPLKLPSPPSRLLGGSKFYDPSNRSLIQFTTTKEYRTHLLVLSCTTL